MSETYNNATLKNAKTEASKIEILDDYYNKTFIKKSGTLARNGKTVYIRFELHERIKRIVQTIGENQISLTDFLDNVLMHHFKMFEQNIIDSYTKKQKPII